LDLPGVVLVTGGLASLVYGCSQVTSTGWTSPSVLGFIGGSVVLLFGFVLRERSTDAPLLPLRIVLDRNRAGASLAAALAIAAMFGAFLFLTYYLQVILRYTPILAGVGFLPLTLASQAGSWGIASVLMPRVPARWIMAPGAVVAAAGMLLLSRIGLESSYLAVVFPAQLLIGIGIACVMAPAFNIGTLGVDPRQAGVAAAVVNAAVQAGASIGTAVLNTIATSTTASQLIAHPSARFGRQALVDGYATGTLWGAGLLLAGGIMAFLMISAGKPARR
jgi:hypothetical protein